VRDIKFFPGGYFLAHPVYYDIQNALLSFSLQLQLGTANCQ